MDCFCPTGDFLIYECIRFLENHAGGTTVWTGTLSVFNCTNHEISLFHGDYESTEGAHGECGDITGQSIQIDANTDNSIATGYYISQLSISAQMQMEWLSNASMMMALHLD